MGFNAPYIVEHVLDFLQRDVPLRMVLPEMPSIHHVPDDRSIVHPTSIYDMGGQPCDRLAPNAGGRLAGASGGLPGWDSPAGRSVLVCVECDAHPCSSRATRTASLSSRSTRGAPRFQVRHVGDVAGWTA